MNRRDFIYSVGMTGASFSFLNAETIPVKETKAKSVIYLFMEGGLSQFDSFNLNVNKEVLGKCIPGKSNVDGIQVSQYYPSLSKQMDKLMVINSMQTNQGAHPAGIYKMLTGYNPRSSIIHPEFGSWVNKTMTKEADSLPNFVSVGKFRSGTAGFFPGQWGALPIQDPNKGISFIKRHGAVDQKKFNNRQAILKQLNGDFNKNHGTKDTKSYEETYAGSLKFMNSKDIDGFDLKKENSNIVKLYDKEKFSRSCLLAARLVERGVRFVKVTLGGWDYHQKIYTDMPANASKLDKGLSSLLMHLSQKGLLESTLVVVSTEFGRTPFVNQNAGRDHHPKGFTTLLAGAGVKGGQIYGSTTKDGKKVAENTLEVKDFNSTIAWRMGIDPKLEEKSANGRPFKIGNMGEARKELFS